MRPILLAFALALAAPLAASAIPARAQNAAPAGADAPLTQVALTEAQVKGFLAAQPDIDAIVAKLAPEAADKPDPKVIAQLDGAAKKYGFASFAEYNTVAGNISLVMDGIDPTTKTYAGADVLLKKQIADIQADAKMKPADKKAAVAEMNAELKAVTPIKNKGNIDLVVKAYDAIAAAMPKDEGAPPAQ